MIALGKKLAADSRVVMTLDAGGTRFRFTAARGGKPCTERITLLAQPHDFTRCLKTLVQGFRSVKALCPEPPVAISFAFPGPADYPNGIIGDLGNLPCFRGGVPLGALLADEFGIPVFINNDGDLFAYGEAIDGFLPYANDLLARVGSTKRYQNLLGVTLGTGFGGGIVRRGELFLGDNSIAGEMWLLRNKLHPTMNVEESVSIRAVQRVYAELTRTSLIDAPEPDLICRIAQGQSQGDALAAQESFRRFGEAAGDALANALTLIDGAVVIGGGLSGASGFFMPALMAELNGQFKLPSGMTRNRLASRAFNLEDEADRIAFSNSTVRQIPVIDCVNLVPRPLRELVHDTMSRVPVGLSRLGTSEAIALGAYAFALQKLDFTGDFDDPRSRAVAHFPETGTLPPGHG